MEPSYWFDYFELYYSVVQDIVANLNILFEVDLMSSIELECIEFLVQIVTGKIVDLLQMHNFVVEDLVRPGKKNKILIKWKRIETCEKFFILWRTVTGEFTCGL